MTRAVACSPQNPFRIFSSAHTFFHRVYDPGPAPSPSPIRTPTPTSSFGSAMIGVWTFLFNLNFARLMPVVSIAYSTELVTSHAWKWKDGGRPSGSGKRKGRRRTSEPGWG